MSFPNPDESDHQAEKARDAEISAQKEQILRQVLSSNARLRLSNVRMVKPDLAMLVENYLIGLVTQGKLNTQISDDQLKQILQTIQQPKRDFKINRR